jgi:hypothetical protein
LFSGKTREIIAVARKVAVGTVQAQIELVARLNQL